MADDPIQIVVTDGVAKTIQPSLEGIATSGDAAASAIAQLQSQVAKFGGLSSGIKLSTQQLEQALTGSGVGARNLAIALAQLQNEGKGAALSQDEMTAAMAALVPVTDEAIAATSALSSEIVATMAANARLSAEMAVAATTIRGYTDAQIAAFKAQQDGANFLNDLNARLGINSTETKSASDSARVFAETLAAQDAAEKAAAEATAALTDLVRGYTLAQIEMFKAQQDGLNFMNALNESFGINVGVTKSAADSASVLAAALDAEDAAFAAINERLAVHNAAIATTSGLVSEFRANLVATAATEDEVAAATGRATSGFKLLSEAILGAFAFQEIAKAADTYIGFTNSIKLAGLSANDTAIVTDRLTKTAEDNGIALDAVSNIYRRLALSQREIGGTTEQMLQFVDGVSAALRINGTSAAAATRVIYDLGESLTRGTVSMQNFKGILTQAPEVAQVAANGIEGLNGSVAKLIAMIKDQKLSGAELFKGIVDGAKAAEVQAAGVNLTVSATFQTLNDAFDVFIGRSGQASGAIAVFNGAILLIAKNLPIVADLALAFGAAWLVVRGIGIATDLYALAAALVTRTIPAMIGFAVTMVTEVIPAIAAFAVAIVTEAIPAFIAMAAGLAEPTIVVIGIAGAFVAVGVAALAATGQLGLIPETIDKVTTGFKSALASIGGTVTGLLGLNQNASQAGDTLDNLMGAFGGAGSSIEETTKKTKEHKTALEELQARIDAMNKSLTTTTYDQYGVASSVTKSTQAFLGADNTINKFTTTTNRAANGTSSITKQMANLSTSLSGLTDPASQADDSVTNLTTKIIQISPVMDEGAQSAYRLSVEAATLNDNFETTITTSDGATHALRVYSDAAIAAGRAADQAASSAQTLAQRMSALAGYQAAAPNLFNDPSNNNGNFTTLGPPTSTPDIIGSYASGGSFVVGGNPGVDTNQVRFRATRGERVTIQTPEQQKAANGNGGNVAHVTMNIYTADANSFRQSRAQIARDTGLAIQAGMGNG